MSAHEETVVHHDIGESPEGENRVIARPATPAANTGAAMQRIIFLVLLAIALVPDDRSRNALDADHDQQRACLGFRNTAKHRRFKIPAAEP